MQYKRLGSTGLRVSELSFGSWVTFGKQLDLDGARACIRAAFDEGVNFFDNAEAYANGVAESMMGEILRSYRREDLVEHRGESPSVDLLLSRESRFEHQPVAKQ